MLKMKSPAEVNEYFNRWYDLTEAERLDTIRSLRNTGRLAIVPNGAPPATDYRCPMNGFAVARPCNLSSCQYYIGPKRADLNSKKRTPKAEIIEAQMEASAGVKNCLIYCLDRSKNGRLSAQEVATVMGISVSEVNSINNNVVAKIRRATVKEQIERIQLPRYNYLEGFCVACGMNIQDELLLNTRPDLSIAGGTHGWCSDECKEDKPKWQFLVERQFKCDYLDVLAVGLQVHQNYDTLGNIMGVNNDILKEHEKDVRRRAAQHKSL